jgi:hypothetical protein
MRKLQPKYISNFDAVHSQEIGYLFNKIKKTVPRKYELRQCAKLQQQYPLYMIQIQLTVAKWNSISICGRLSSSIYMSKINVLRNLEYKSTSP